MSGIRLIGLRRRLVPGSIHGLFALLRSSPLILVPVIAVRVAAALIVAVVSAAGGAVRAVVRTALIVLAIRSVVDARLTARIIRIGAVGRAAVDPESGLAAEGRRRGESRNAGHVLGHLAIIENDERHLLQIRIARAADE